MPVTIIITIEIWGLVDRDKLKRQSFEVASVFEFYFFLTLSRSKIGPAVSHPVLFCQDSRYQLGSQVIVFSSRNMNRNASHFEFALLYT